MRKRLSARIFCRAEPELYAAVAAEAQRLGISTSKVIRRALAASFIAPEAPRAAGR